MAAKMAGYRYNRSKTGRHRINRKLSMLDKRSHRKFRGRHETAARKRKISIAEKRARRMHRTKYGRRTYFVQHVRAAHVRKHVRHYRHGDVTIHAHVRRPHTRMHPTTHRRPRHPRAARRAA